MVSLCNFMDEELNAMPHALRLIADQITAPDHVPAMCLRDAAAMIESLAMQRDKLRDGIKAVLTENAHLADGEVCTLIDLKRLVPEWESEFLANT